jgi:AmmeMemoRadiSam system protein B
MTIRPPAVAGSWYPGGADELSRRVDGYLDVDTPRVAFADLVALVAPHAGLMYSGAVAGHAYALLRRHQFDLIVMVGPSHFVPFEGVSVFPRGGFRTPFGTAPIDERCAAALMDSTPVVRDLPAAHAREHSLEMQLPFVQRLAPDVPIVPLVMGHQTADTASQLAGALASTLKERRVLLIASTDLSHYHDAATAARMDRVVVDHVDRFDADGLQLALDRNPDHACGGGPTVAVLRAARHLGAQSACVLNYADSGDVSGDKSSVVGYMAAAIGVTIAASD